MGKLALILALFIGASSPVQALGFIKPAGPVAEAQLSHFGTISLLMLLVIVPLFVVLPIVLFRYRRRGNATFRPDWDFNWGLEVLIWGVPVLLVTALGAALWSHTLKYDPYKPLGPDPLLVEVVSLDWKFLFLYPEQNIATMDLLVLPKGRPVTFKLTSGTVMQSFMIPQLAGQIYTMGGMITQLNLIADKAGTFIGRNTQYNGTGFATQSFQTKVVEQTEFNDWVLQAKQSSEALDWAKYQHLLAPTIEHEPVIYSSMEEGLFDRVIDSSVPGMAQMTSDNENNKAMMVTDHAHHMKGQAQ